MVSSCAAYGCTRRQNKPGIAFHRFPVNMVLRQKWIEATRRANFNPTSQTRLCSEHFSGNDYKDYHITGKKKLLKRNAVPSIFDFGETLTTEKNRVSTLKVATFFDNNPVTVSESSLSEATYTSNGFSMSTSTVTVKVEPEDSTNLDNASNPVNSVPESSPRSIGTANVVSIPPKSTMEEVQSKDNTIIRKRKREAFIGDFTIDDMNNPTKAKKFYILTQQTVKKLKKKLKLDQQKIRLLKLRLNSMPNLRKHRERNITIKEIHIYSDSASEDELKIDV